MELDKDIIVDVELVDKKELKTIRNKTIFLTLLVSSFVYSVVFMLFILYIGGIIDTDSRKLDNVLELYKSMYIGDIEYSDIVDGAIQGVVVASKDKYGGYIPAIQKNTVSDKINTGKYLGFGFTYEIKEGYIEIKDIVEDSSAGRSSLQIGDKITYINNEVLTDDVLNKFILEVSEGTINSVLFTLKDSTQVELEVGVVNMPKISTNITNNIGYIKIYTFVEDTVDLFQDGIDLLLKEDVDEIIFDLRGNNGGSLDAVVDMLDYITKDVLIVRVEYKTGKEVEYFSDTNTVFNGEKSIKILVDSNTASAAELFTMCLQDVYNAKVIGQTTYGKSTVLSNFMFKDGSMLAMSTGMYYSLKGRYIEDMGIEPDVLLEDSVILKSSTELYEIGLLQ